MKKYIDWIIGIVGVFIGLIMLFATQVEMAANSRYTWKPPYTEYETQVITVKWVGIFFLILGLISIGLKIYRIIYTNKHIQDMNQLTKEGGTVKCLECGLEISANTEICPRCGKSVIKTDMNHGEYRGVRYCIKCGSLIGMNQKFCGKCGNKTIKE